MFFILCIILYFRFLTIGCNRSYLFVYLNHYTTSTLTLPPIKLLCALISFLSAVTFLHFSFFFAVSLTLSYVLKKEKNNKENKISFLIISFLSHCIVSSSYHNHTRIYTHSRSHDTLIHAMFYTFIYTQTRMRIHKQSLKCVSIHTLRCVDWGIHINTRSQSHIKQHIYAHITIFTQQCTFTKQP